MQAQTINWATVALALGPAVITAISTAVGSWLLYRHQLKTKVAEIRGQTGLRARELLFESFQKRIDRRDEGIKQFVSTLMTLVEHLKVETDEESKRQSGIVIIALIKMIREPFLDSVSELEEEFKLVGLTDKRRKDISTIRQTLAVDLDKVEIKNVGELYLDFMKSIGLFTSLKDELLNIKCEDLFSVYLSDKSNNSFIAKRS